MEKKKTLNLVGFIGSIIGYAIFFALTIILFIYAIVTTIAFHSPMISLVVFGSTFLSLGIGLSLVMLSTILKKKYEQKDEPNKTQHQGVSLTDILNIKNADLVILIVGVILIVVSSILGCINKEKWIIATRDYKNTNGYYEDTRTYNVQYDITGYTGVKKISIELDTKNVVVIYDSAPSCFVKINGFTNYDGQISTSISASGNLSISEEVSPKLDTTLNKMLFFMYLENPVEKQIRVTIPLAYKDQIEIVGDYILAK